MTNFVRNMETFVARYPHVKMDGLPEAPGQALDDELTKEKPDWDWLDMLFRE